MPLDAGQPFGIVFVRLPVSEPDPVARVRAVRERMGRVKAGAQAASTFAILAIVGALPSWAHRLAVRVLGAKSSAVVTNVPGPREPVFLAGARLERLVFWVPQAGTIGLGVSILSYAGDVTVGVAADRKVVPGTGRAHPRGRGGAVGTGPRRRCPSTGRSRCARSRSTPTWRCR